MLRRTKIATFVGVFFSAQAALAANNQLDEISVVEVETSDYLVSTNVTREEMFLKQAHDVKDIFKDKLDVNVSQLQGSRAGGEGVNIRGLQANRVSTTVDGIPLPESQEAKHFISYGLDFGRDDYLDVSGLREAQVQYAGSANSLSGSVNFATLEPVDVLKGKNAGGFFATGYNSVDNSVYGSLGGAVKTGAYQGLLMTTIRGGNATKNQGSNAGIGVNRTEPNPTDTQNNYLLTKHYYQLDDHNRIGATFEYQRKKIKTELLSLDGTSIDAGTGVQLKGNSVDRVKRSRFSLSHDYHNDKGWLQSAQTQIYYQDSSTDNYRLRSSASNYRLENAKVENKVYGINANLMSLIESRFPQILRYGFTYNHSEANNDLHYVRPGYNRMPYRLLGAANFNGHPTANTKQDKFTAYVEDEVTFGKWAITPQLGFVYYRVSPKGSSAGLLADYQLQKRHETKFTPKLSIEYRLMPEFIPYAQYSRGVRTPSPQQLTSYFSENPMGFNVAVLGNPNLRAETADNFEVGIKGENSRFHYLVTGYYNRYHNFIDWVSAPRAGYTSFVQYANLDKAKVYGVTADGKWNFYDDYFVNGGFAYARGHAINNNNQKEPINSIQPMKVKFGVGYAGDTFGANVQWSYNRGKADKDITQASTYLYNPTGGYSLVDLGVYWKPTASLTLTANVNNLFDKKYWNWNDISYLALLSKASTDIAGSNVRPTTTMPMSITSANADRYSAPGRNFNVGLRYEF